jgi:hypothetical protein
MGRSVRRLQGWEPSESTSYEYDVTGRLSSSRTTVESEFDPTDIAWLEALEEYERTVGPHGFTMAEATDPDADPNSPNSHYRFRAGVPVTTPEGRVEWGVQFDWAEKARLDFIDRARGNDPDALNGAIIPVHRQQITPRAERQARRARRAAGPPE